MIKDFTRGGFLLLSILLISALAGTASAVLVSNSLERYAASLLNDRRFAALTPLEHGRSATTREEALAHIQEVVPNAFVSFVDAHDEKKVLGTGIVVSADGWILAPKSVLSAYLDKKGTYTGFEVLRGDDVFVVEKVVPDTQTDVLALHVSHAQGWTPLELAESDEVLPGAELFGVGGVQNVFATSVQGRQEEANNPVPAEEPRNLWGITDSLSLGYPILTLQSRFFGFVLSSGDVLPAQALRPLVKQVLRGALPIHAALGATIMQTSSGNVIITPVQGERTGVLKNGPADIAGLTDGDILLAIDDIAFTRTVTCADILATYAPGQTVTFTVSRGGEVREREVTLGTWEELVY